MGLDAPIIGLVAIAVGIGLMTGDVVAARIVGIIIAVISAIVDLILIAAYRLRRRSIIGSPVDVIVIYAIVVHGRELKA